MFAHYRVPFFAKPLYSMREILIDNPAGNDVRKEDALFILLKFGFFDNVVSRKFR